MLNQLWARLALKRGLWRELISAAAERKFLVVWRWISCCLRDVPDASSCFQPGESTDCPGAAETPARRETHNPAAGRDTGNKCLFAERVKRPALN